MNLIDVKPEIIGLVRGEPKRRKRNRVNGEILADKYWDAMCADAGAYRIKSHARDGSEITHGLRSNAIIGFAIKVDLSSFCYDSRCMTKAEAIAKLGNDIFATLSCIDASVHKDDASIFRVENLRGCVRSDYEGYEGRYMIGDARMPSGNYCGKRIDVALRLAVEEQFPERMYYLGWHKPDIGSITF